MMDTRSVSGPHISGTAQSVGVDVLHGLNGETMFVWKSRCRSLPCTGVENVLWQFGFGFQKAHTTCEIRDEQSQQKLNCALPTQVARLEDGPAQVCKNSGCDRFSLIKNFPEARKSRGNLNSRSDQPMSPYQRNQLIKWS